MVISGTSALLKYVLNYNHVKTDIGEETIVMKKKMKKLFFFI